MSLFEWEKKVLLKKMVVNKKLKHVKERLQVMFYTKKKTKKQREKNDLSIF